MSHHLKEFQNGVMMQYFHWYTPADGKLWKQLAKNAETLGEAGITAVWLPPSYKGAEGGDDVGYSVYDLFDLGEFDQKGSVRTRYGTREEYLAGIKAAQKASLQVYADIVFNHKLGADDTEELKATPYSPNNRHEATGELQDIRAWTHFKFPGQNDKYSKLKWHWWHFNAADFNALDEKTDAIYLFEGKKFDESVDRDKGNFDYLMGCNLDINNPDVQTELFYWGEWFLETTGVDGFRFDATKHVKSYFFLEWLEHIRKHSGRNLFAVGEYWSGDVEALENFIKVTDGSMMLFDVNLHFNFARAGKEGKDFNLQTIFDNTLVKYYGAHYTGMGQDGNEHEIWMDSHQWLIDKFLFVRKEYAHCVQYDYFDHPNCIGWTRRGKEGEELGMAVLISNGEEGIKQMETGSPETTYVDITKHIEGTVTTNKEGWGEFRCKGGSVSVWVPE